MRDHAGRALHERLEHHRGDLVAPAGDHRLGRQRGGLEAVPRTGRPAIDVWRRDAQHVEQQRLEDLVEEVHPADAHRADRVAVVRLAQRHEARLPGLAALPPVLEGDLQRHFHRGRPRIGEEDLVELRLPLEVGRAADQLRGQLDRGRRGEAEKRGVRHLLQLQPDGAVDLGLAVPVHVHPQRRDAVQVLAAERIEEPGAARVIDDHRLVTFGRLDPALHLRERVPEVSAVEREQPLGPLARVLRCGGDVLSHAGCILALRPRVKPRAVQAASWSAERSRSR